MTEQEWNESSDPARMLQWATGGYNDGSTGTDNIRHKTTDRRLRLFACACCRAVWHLLTDERCRKCIEAAERYADDHSAIISPYYGDAAERFEEMDNSGQGELWNAVLARHVCNTRDSFVENVAGTIVPAVLRKQKTTPIVIANLLRDIIGNPFRPVTLPRGNRKCNFCEGYGTLLGAGPDRSNPKCTECDGTGKQSCPWLTPTVVSLATAAYQERGRVCGECAGRGTIFVCDPNDAFAAGAVKCSACHGTGRIEGGTLDNDRLAVLADALEDAGMPAEIECEKCHNGWVTRHEYRERVGAICGVGQKPCPHCGGVSSVHNPILAHLRSEGPHVRGCWVIDLILGKS